MPWVALPPFHIKKGNPMFASEIEGVALGNGRTDPTGSAAANTMLVEMLAADLAALHALAGWPEDEAAARAWFDSLYQSDFAQFCRLLAEFVVFRDLVGKADAALQARYAGFIGLAEIAKAVFDSNRQFEAAIFGAPLH
jgi:hypothetical protein